MSLSSEPWSGLPDPFRAPVEPPTEIARALILGVERMQAAIRSPTGDLVQITSGPLEARVLRHSRDDVHVSGVSLSAGIRSAGVTSARHVTLRVALPGPSGGRLNGAPLEPATALLWGPGTEYEGYTAPGQRWLSSQVPLDLLVGQLASSPGSLAALERATLREVPLCASDLPLLARLLDEMGARASARPALGPAPDPVARAVELVLGIAARVGQAQGGGDPPRRSPDPLHAVERHFLEHLASEVYVGAAARAAGVAERTLQSLFRSRYGVSPLAYLEAMRLHAARRLLRGAGQDPRRTVAAVARETGHRHLGRFAGRYRAFFGESPRETRARALDRPGP